MIDALEGKLFKLLIKKANRAPKMAAGAAQPSRRVRTGRIHAILVKKLEACGILAKKLEACGHLTTSSLAGRVKWGSGKLGGLGSIKKYVDDRPHLFAVAEGVVTLKKPITSLEVDFLCNSDICSQSSISGFLSMHHESSADSYYSASSESVPTYPDCSPFPVPTTSSPEGGIMEKGVIQADTVAKTCPTSSPVVETKRKRGECQSAQELKEWLIELDEGRGDMLQYMDALVEEFEGNLYQVSVAWRGTCVGESKVDSVYPEFWTALGVRKLGHKLLFVSGLAALQKSQ